MGRSLELTVEDTIIGLVGGFSLSLVTFYLSTKVTRKAERKENLRKHVRKFFPLLRELGEDLSYATSMRMRSGSTDTQFEELSAKIAKELDYFAFIYANFRKAGLEPELESSDKRMSDELKGLFTLWKIGGHNTLADNPEKYYSRILICRNLIEGYLKR